MKSKCEYCGKPVENKLPIHRECAQKWLHSQIQHFTNRIEGLIQAERRQRMMAWPCMKEKL
jgi:hypothetical protein